MLKSKRARIVLALVGVFALILCVAWLSGIQKDICKETNAGQERCTSYNLAPFILIKIYEVLHALEGVITALATGTIAWFTWTLWQSNEKMWRINKIATIATRRAANAARKSADAA